MSIAETLNDRDLKLESRRNFLKPEQQKAWDDFYGPQNEKFREAEARGRRPGSAGSISATSRITSAASPRWTTTSAGCWIISTTVGLAKNTVVIYSSDQGFFLGDHGWFDKRFIYEESLRMPLIVRWPGVTKAGSGEPQTSCRTSTTPRRFSTSPARRSPDDMQGRSIVPLLKGQTPDDWRKSTLLPLLRASASEHIVHRHYGVRTDRYKLINFYDRKQWELFDLEEDPHEMKNVYEDPKYKQVRDDLTAELKRLQLEYKEADPDLANERIRAKQRTPPAGTAEGRGVSSGAKLT